MNTHTAHDSVPLTGDHSLAESQSPFRANAGGGRLMRMDWVLAAILGIMAAFGTWSLARRVPTAVTCGTHLDVYYSADCGRVLANMRFRTESNHHRTNVHPLFSILMHPTYTVLARITGANISADAPAPRFLGVSYLLSAIGGGMAMALLVLTLRVMGTPVMDTSVYAVLAASSAFSLFWFSVPETYAWGAISILFALLVAAVGCGRQLHVVWYALASLGTFAVTTTNWTVGLLATWTRWPWRKSLAVTAAVVCAASGLSIAQKLVFPSSWFFFNIAREKNYMMQEHSGGPVASVRSLLFHTVVAPEPGTMVHPRYPDARIIRIQDRSAGGSSWVGKVGAALWVVLLAGGIWALFRHRGMLPFRITLGLSLVGQCMLHSVYGAETFLYSAHFGPMMLICVAFLAQTRFRFASLSVAAILAVLLLVNNLARHAEVMDLIRSL